MTIGERIKLERTTAGLSQEQLANKLSVSRSAIAKWESGNGIPDIDNLILLCDEFSITMDELVRGDDTLKSQVKTQREKRNTIDLICGILFLTSAIIWGLSGILQIELQDDIGSGIIDFCIGALNVLPCVLYLKKYDDGKKEI